MATSLDTSTSMQYPWHLKLGRALAGSSGEGWVLPPGSPGWGAGVALGGKGNALPRSPHLPLVSCPLSSLHSP